MLKGLGFKKINQRKVEKLSVPIMIRINNLNAQARHVNPKIMMKILKNRGAKIKKQKIRGKPRVNQKAKCKIRRVH